MPKNPPPRSVASAQASLNCQLWPSPGRHDGWKEQATCLACFRVRYAAYPQSPVVASCRRVNRPRDVQVPKYVPRVVVRQTRAKMSTLHQGWTPPPDSKRITNGVLLEDIEEASRPAAITVIDEQINSIILPQLRSLRRDYIGSVYSSHLHPSEYTIVTNGLGSEYRRKPIAWCFAITTSAPKTSSSAQIYLRSSES